jgi:hypothetical protein
VDPDPDPGGPKTCGSGSATLAAAGRKNRNGSFPHQVSINTLITSLQRRNYYYCSFLSLFVVFSGQPIHDAKLHSKKRMFGKNEKYSHSDLLSMAKL